MMASEQAKQAIRQFGDESYALANRVSVLPKSHSL